LHSAAAHADRRALASRLAATRARQRRILVFAGRNLYRSKPFTRASRALL